VDSPAGPAHRHPGAAAPSFAGTTLDPRAGPPVSEMTWLSAYQDVDEAFRSRDFVQGGGGRRDSAPFSGDGLLSLSGDDHFERRRIESVLFRRATLRHYEVDVLAPALAAALDACASRRDRDGAVRTELLGFLRSVIHRVSAAMVGLDGVNTPEATERFVACMVELSAGVNVEWASRDHREVIREALESKRRFVRDFFAPSWRRREALVAAAEAGRLPEAALPQDLLTVMIESRRHFARWDADVVVREAILFNGAATNTVALAIPHVIAELDAWRRGHPEARGRVEEPGFLRLAIAETLRLHPASPFLIRRATRPTRLPGGRLVQAGEYVVLDLVSASRDVAAFGPDAGEFDPHRVPPVRIRPMGLGFGGGPHTCIGMGLAVGEAPGRTDDPESPLGLMVYTLRELYRAGIELDPTRLPRWNDASVREEYVEFPVRLAGL
jgi:cytochrome P450